MTNAKFSIRSIIDAARRGALSVIRFIPSLIRRAYGLALLVFICWLTFLSIRYLVRSLLVPSATPEQIVGIPKRLGPDILGTDQSAWKAIAAAETPRMPPAHYHRIDSWIDPDRFNDCTRSGCHGPLPHGRSQEVRAFLNMHATSIHCGVCHMTTESEPLKLAWYDLETGQAQSPPAILRVYETLTAPRDGDFDRDFQRQVVHLLKLAAKDVGDSNGLEQLRQHFRAARPGSAAFARLVEGATTALPRYFRGEYGAKLALVSKADEPILGHPGTASDVQAFLNDGAPLSERQREDLIERIHPRRREQALTCSACHSKGESLIAFEDLGYPPARLRALSDPLVFQMIENIDAGVPFELPRFLTPAQAEQP